MTQLFRLECASESWGSCETADSESLDLGPKVMHLQQVRDVAGVAA